MWGKNKMLKPVDLLADVQKSENPKEDAKVEMNKESTVDFIWGMAGDLARHLANNMDRSFLETLEQRREQQRLNSALALQQYQIINTNNSNPFYPGGQIWKP